MESAVSAPMVHLLCMCLLSVAVSIDWPQAVGLRCRIQLRALALATSSRIDASRLGSLLAFYGSKTIEKNMIS
jgi:hypothetical protein